MDLLLIRWKHPRRSLDLPELNTYPVTVIAVNPYPGWVLSFKKTRNTTNRKNQVNLFAPVYPLIPPYIAWVTHFEHTKNSTNHKLVKTKELNEYPATPIGYYSGYFPGSALAKSNKFNFRRKEIKLPEINVYPVAPAPSQPITSWLTHFEQTKKTKRKIVSVEHDNYPVTPKNYGFYPGSKSVEALRIGFDIKLAKLPEHNIYPSTPVPGQPITAWATHFERTKQTKRSLRLVEHDVFPQTPAAFYNGFYPGSEIAKSNRIKFTLKIQLLPEHNVYPSTLVPGQPITSWLGHFEVIKNATNRKTISTPEYNRYPVFAPYPSYLERQAFKHKSKYDLKTVPEHNDYPITPAGYYSGYFPGSGLALSNKISFKHKLITIPELNVYPITPVITEPIVSWVTHFEKIKNLTNRKTLNLELNQYPAPILVPGGPNFGVSAILNADAYGALGLIDADSFGVVGLLNADAYGVNGILDAKSFGVKGSIDNNAYGVIGELGN